MIHVSGLHKSFTSGSGRKRQRVVAVEDVSLVARDGEITGLLGPNGAGKTTTLRIIATLIAAERGRTLVDGIDSKADPMAARQVMGVLSEARGLYHRLTASENIRYYGRLRGMSDGAIDASIDKVAHLIDMGALLKRRVDGFSQGERMKVAIARALVHDPKNLVLDEPTNGLDIMSTRALRDLIKRLRDDGKCILMSSHIMQEVSALSDRIVVIARGRALHAGSAEELMQLAGASNLEDAFVTLTGSASASESVEGAAP